MPAIQLNATLDLLRDARDRLNAYNNEATTEKAKAKLAATDAQVRQAIKSLSSAVAAELDADAAAP